MIFFSNIMSGGDKGFLFEIRLDNCSVVLRGTEDEAAGQLLTGKVTLHSSRALRVGTIHLKMTGQKRITWYEEIRMPYGQVSHNVDKTVQVFSHQVTVFACEGRPRASSEWVMLSPGIHEWPFEIYIPGNTPESIEGPHKSYVTYEMEAIMIRSSLLPDKHATKPVRIIRVHQGSELDFANGSTAEGVWMKMAEYQVSLPQRRALLGSTIQINIRITPMLKGIKMERIQCRLLELCELQISTTSHKACKEVARWTFDGHEISVDRARSENCVFSQLISLPRSLGKCTQDVSVQGINVHHVLSITVEMYGQDDQSSKLQVTLPVVLLISPNMVIDRTGSIVGMDQNEFVNDLVDLDGYMLAPPPYGEHVFDESIR